MAKKLLVCAISIAILASLTWLGLDWAKPKAGADRSDADLLKTQAKALAKEADALVNAIYTFKRNCGLWPCTLAELPLEVVSSPATQKWQYVWYPNDWWHLTCYFALPDSAVRYEKRPDFEGWQLTNGIDTLDLGIPRPQPITPLTAPELRRNLRLEMQKRLAVEPDKMLHYQGWISYLYRGGDLGEAEGVSRICLKRWPEHWWPNLALSIIQAQEGEVKDAEQRLRRFTMRRSDFNHAFFLAHFYFTIKDYDRAFETLHQATRMCLQNETGGDSRSNSQLSMNPCFNVWRSALLAYRHKRLETAFAVCDRWERYLEEDNPNADASFHTIRAACYLMQGKTEEAQNQVAKMRRAMLGRHWGDNIDELEQAIKQRQTTFVYEPLVDTPFTPFIEYK